MSSTFIHESAYVEEGASLGEGAKVWHFCHIRKGAVLGASVSLGRDVYVDSGVTIGDHTRVQNGVSIYHGVQVEPWCFIGPHVIFTNDMAPRACNKDWKVVETKLRAGMSIGAGSIIRCGVTLGEFCMVGAGAIVTHDIPPFHLVTGVPAKIQKMICACGQTFLPLESKSSELIRDCCEKNMQTGALELARKLAHA